MILFRKLRYVLKELRPADSEPIDYEVELKRQYPELEFVRPKGEAVYRVKEVPNGPLILKRALAHSRRRVFLILIRLAKRTWRF